MPRYRLYIKEKLINKTSSLENAEFHYLKNVLRMKEGDEVALFNEQDGEWCAKIMEIGKKNLQLEITEQIKPPLPSRTNGIFIMFAPLKGERVDFIAEKCSELSVMGLGGILTARTSVRNLNLERFSLRVKEACEQCGRLDIPAILPLQKLEDFIANFDFKTANLYFLDERMSGADNSKIEQDKIAYFLIGPEGGFSPEEFAYMQAKGAKGVHLQGNILRAETAAMSICAIYNNMLG
jgi:16S rRNA (uracil1498-N3)-methyltransferase